MNKLLAAILLATTALVAHAESRVRRIEVMCGSIEDVQKTMEKYNEKLVMMSLAPNQQTVNLVFANFETQTTSWFVQDLESNEYCMIGIGNGIIIPKESPLSKSIGIGTKINLK